MKYKINIQKYIENPNYSDKLKEYKEASERERNYGYYGNKPNISYPELFLSSTALEVELTDEEYKKVKAEVIKVFE